MLRVRLLGLPRKGTLSKPVLSKTKKFEIVNNMFIIRKKFGESLKFGVSWFLNHENQFTGSKADQKNQKNHHFWKMSIF